MVDEYVVVVDYVKNDKTNKVFNFGELVSSDDFPKYVIKGWVDKDPCVLYPVIPIEILDGEEE